MNTDQAAPEAWTWSLLSQGTSTKSNMSKGPHCLYKK